MTGITDLSRLLESLEPVLLDGEFVFATVLHATFQEFLPLKPMAMFHEQEGMTLILPKTASDHAGLVASPPFRCLTMMVHSSLEAVGLTAAIATALANDGISANVVAAFYHDHVFVPAADADRAVSVLRALTKA